MFNVRREGDAKLIASSPIRSDAILFAKMYTQGTDDQASSVVWLYEEEPMVSEIRIAIISHGDVYHKE